MPSRQVSIRANNVPSDGNISFKNGFPSISFTIQNQNGLLDPNSIRLVGDLSVFSDNATPPTPAVSTDELTMNNRLGIYGVMDHLIVRNHRSNMVIEDIRNYNKFLSTYFGATSSVADLSSHLNESCLIMPNQTLFKSSVVDSQVGVSAAGTEGAKKNSFSAHLISGFFQGGNQINLMESSHGAIEIEIFLSPDSNVLYAEDGTTTGLEDAHYVLSDVQLTYQVQDIPASQMADMAGESTGSYEFNSITSLYTSINSTNANIQYGLGIRDLQSVFMTFTPSANINNLAEDALATTYPSIDTSAGLLSQINRVQFLKGGVKFPLDFDVSKTTDANPLISDPEIVKLLINSILPEYQTDRTAIGPLTMSRDYDMLSTAGSYKSMPNGGPLSGIGVRYSQFNSGQDFSSEQWGCTIETDLTGDNPISVFIFFKHKSTVLWSPNGVQVIS
jgi:hypothetical protein